MSTTHDTYYCVISYAQFYCNVIPLLQDFDNSSCLCLLNSNDTILDTIPFMTLDMTPDIMVRLVGDIFVDIIVDVMIDTMVDTIVDIMLDSVVQFLSSI